MSGILNRLCASRKTGDEQLHAGGQALGVSLRSFWQWSASDLVSNATRGILAEFIVAYALGISLDGLRDEWGAYDLETNNGTKVEVKSAAYVQSWHQTKHSTISFRTPKTLYWDANTNIYAEPAKRQADVYVFALLAHQDKPTIDPMNLDQWRFYVLPTSALDKRTRSQHSITLPTLEKMSAGPHTYAELDQAVKAVAS